MYSFISPIIIVLLIITGSATKHSSINHINYRVININILLLDFLCYLQNDKNAQAWYVCEYAMLSLRANRHGRLVKF